jgi:broad specificity phosphatase PhoE
VGLNEKGLDQANRLAERLSSQFPIDVLYSSPLNRAKQCATIISEKLGIEIQFTDDLLEYSFGPIAGIRYDDVKERYPDLYTELINWSEAPLEDRFSRPELPGLEPMDHIKTRIQRFTEKVIAENEGHHIAVVTHGGFIKCAMTFFSGAPFSQKMPFFVENASISIVDFYKGNPVIRLVNDISHTNDVLKMLKPLPL